MAEEAKKKKNEVNAVADGHNWDQRIRVEMEAPHKWIEAWGPYFTGDVPLEYDERIKYFEQEVKKIPASAIHPVKYGLGKPFPNIGSDHRRKKMFYNPELDPDLMLDDTKPT